MQLKMRLYFLFLIGFVLIDAKIPTKSFIHDQSKDSNSVQLEQIEKTDKVLHTHSTRRSASYRHKTKYLKSIKDNDILLSKEFMNSSPEKSGLRCGYGSCQGRKDGKINVHIINHSHDDVGWLKTVDQYFYGNKNNVQRAGVQYIISSVIDELKKDPKRKFIFVEIAFFKMWFEQQDEKTRNYVKQLVNEGRFEFISGGWSMNDEAAAHYISIIDQMTLGHHWLLNNFGGCAIPTIGWQIDPFGHSREQANLFAQMGFDGLFFGRLDYNDKGKRANEKTMEMLWRGSDDLGKSSDLFTGVLPNGYNPPNGFCFDDTCADEAIVDNKKSVDYNVKRRVDEYIKAIQHQAKNYKTNDLIHTMGSDFQYQNALPWYKNLDLLMKYVHEANSSINVFYSTPTCYLKALNEANITWNTKSDDFFPYSSDPNAFWSGYFTSRPAFKGFERWASGHLQSTKHLQVMAGLFNDEHNELRDRLREALGVSQHHDAITGTEKQNVYSDYVLTLSRGVEAANELIIKSLNKIYNNTNYPPKLVENEVEFCKKLNVSECRLSEEQNKFVIHLYNPVSHSVQHLVRLPIKHLKNENDVLLLNSKGQQVTFDVVDIAQHVQNIPERDSDAQKELVFLAQLNATSLSTFSIDLTNATKAEKSKNNQDEAIKTEDVTILEGLGFKLYVDSATGTTQKIVLQDGQEIKFEHEYKYYVGMNGDNKQWSTRASGAYIFRNNGTVKTFDKQNSYVNIVKKATLSEVHVKTNNFVAESIKVHKNLPYIEFDYVVGPIPVDDQIGKEIISVFKTDLKTDAAFYTDSNGRQLLKRVRNQRPTYTYDATVEPVSSNYYPLNSKMELRDEEKQLKLSVLLDRSQGGSSLNDGEVELMVHRRLLHDDAFGVDEALNEPGLRPGEKGDGLIIRGVHRVLISSLNKDQETDYTTNELAVQASLQPMIALRKLDQDVNTREIYVKTNEESILNGALPKCVNLLTLESLDRYKIVRFEHLYGKIDQAQCSAQTVELDISKIFNSKYKAAIYFETFLTANQPKGPIRMKWKSDFDQSDSEEAERRRRIWMEENKNNLPSFTSEQNDEQAFAYSSKFKLSPTEIKTFLIVLEKASEME